jgi:anaerobic magnesium-protoporphyrin IX monomethyl ester cyclase
MSARGCPSQCVFCNVPQTFMSRHFRMRSAKDLVEEMEWIKKNMPEIKEIFVDDDTMTIDKNRMHEISRLIKERNLKIVWSTNARADIPKDVLKEMKEAGCRMLIVGYESGNQQILKNIKKGITLKQAEQFAEDAREVGIKVFGCFMIGLPGDTKETIRETIEWAKKLKPDMIQIEQIVPFPGTEFYDWAKAKGYLKTEDPDEWLDETGQLGFLIDYPNLSSKEIKEMRDKLTLEFYTDPRQTIRIFLNNLHPREFVRLVKATKDYFAYLLKKRFG